LGRLDTQRGQRMGLKCRACKRPLGIFYIKKSINSTPKIVIFKGSVHKTENKTIKIYVECKCGAKTVFENQSEIITKHGWRRTN
jgi:hypothetical protein